MVIIGEILVCSSALSGKINIRGTAIGVSSSF